MKRKCILIIITILLGVLSFPNSADAASKNRTAGKAYAKALKNGTINYTSGMSYNIADMNGDGVKDLLINQDGVKSTVYTYKNGRLTTLLTCCPEYRLVYCTKKKAFFMSGEGAGGWVTAYKLKNGQLIEKYSYSALLGPNGITYEYRTSNNVRKSISAKTYSNAWKLSNKYTYKTTKVKLINKLKKLK